MVDYETFCRIRDHLVRQQLSVAQTARALGPGHTHRGPVGRRRAVPARRAVQRASKLDAFKGQIVRWLDAHPYSAQQIYQRLADAGYDGGITIVKDYVHRIRPRPRPAFLKLDFEPGECAQIDWGEFGTVAVGNTRRPRRSRFLTHLCSPEADPPSAQLFVRTMRGRCRQEVWQGEPCGRRDAAHEWP